MSQDYAQFLARKAIKAPLRGLSRSPELASHLFPFQALTTDFALRVGTAGAFLDTGMGKTEIMLEWCQKALEAENVPALILTPLAVAGQTARRAAKYGYEARVIREMADAGPRINICNYDRLDHLDASAFPVIALDEASILKSFTGRTTRALIEAFKGARFKLCATATPAPNDHMELGNYSEFLDVMAAQEMLSRFFINDASTASQEWRLKGHAVTSFWDWMASYARMAEKPSDITGNAADDANFILPAFEIKRHRARDSSIENILADLFGTITMSATTMHDVKRQTSEARAEIAGGLVSADPNETWIIWCDTDYEADALKRAIPSAIDVRGSMSPEEKEDRIEAFSTGKAKHLIGKPSMLGLGLDWSHCARMAFVGRSYSYEQWYQAVRRAWRFGQKRNLQVHIVVAEGEAEIGRVVDRKADDHAKMKRAMRDAMARACGQSVGVKTAYEPNRIVELPTWIRSAA